MAIDEKRVRQAVRRFHIANSRLLEKHPFYAVLLLKMKYSLDEYCETAYTDGERIAFNPDFMDSLDDRELDFVLMHEILHVVLDHCGRTKKEYDPQLFNIACDIVVNSNILYSNDMDLRSITLREYGESMHKLEDGSEGFRYTAEEVYDKLARQLKEHKDNKDPNDSNDSDNHNDPKKPNAPKDSKDSRRAGKTGDSFDDHGKWHRSVDADGQDGNERKDKLEASIVNAYEMLKTLGKLANNIPAGVEREIGNLINPQTDWRTVLADFVQKEINDYSFIPPDRRMADNDLFLPDFNETCDSVENILFMVDTSGSMTDETITACFSEIRGALEQFDGRLSGFLGFFDAAVIPPVEFSTIDELKVIRPVGGGGTSFHIIFDYVRDKMQDRLPASIVILTDGEADIPDQKEAMGIPVLWVLTSDVEIPWGKTTRISVG